jgi:hypothetical protein
MSRMLAKAFPPPARECISSFTLFETLKRRKDADPLRAAQKTNSLTAFSMDVLFFHCKVSRKLAFFRSFSLFLFRFAAVA